MNGWSAPLAAAPSASRLDYGGAPRVTERVLEKILDESFVRSFRVAMLVAAGLALASALCAGLMIGPQRRKPQQLTVISARVVFEQHISGK
jgi:hypothetical protein